VALGNAARAQPGARPAIVQALRKARPGADDLVREHVDWALAQSEAVSTVQR